MHMSDDELTAKMREASLILNIKPHIVCDKNPTMIYSCCDLEGHRGKVRICVCVIWLLLFVSIRFASFAGFEFSALYVSFGFRLCLMKIPMTGWKILPA